ncbi:signal peptidase I SipW [Sutcliffiella cohnii]
MNKKKIMKIISNVVTGFLFLTLVFMVIVVISSKASGGEPQVLGYQLKTVLSGSMEPEFKTGSIIAVKPVEDPTSLQEGTVITYTNSEGSFVTHRIIDVIQNGEHTMYQTKGDNNADIDGQLVLSQNVVAEYTGFTIPLLGYFIDFAKSSKGTAILLITPGILLLIYSGISITSAIRELDKMSKKASTEELDKPANIG